MLITLLLMLSTSFAPLTLTASPVEFPNSVQCVHLPNAPPARFFDCTNLLRLLSNVPRFHELRTYTAGDSIRLGFASCVFQLRGKEPWSGVRERIKLIDCFPALQQISDECLETPEGYNGGQTPVGAYFWGSLGADIFSGAGGNVTVVREGPDARARVSAD